MSGSVSNPLTPLSLDLTPIEVAAGLRHLEGLAFLDTSLERENAPAHSIIAANPSGIVEGEDWGSLEAVLAQHSTPHSAHHPLPTGAAIGFVDYDGTFRFGIYPDLLVFDHATRQWFSSGNLSAQIRTNTSPPSVTPTTFTSQTSLEEFCRMVQRAQQYISAGDIYQVNLAHKFSAPAHDDPFAFYQLLRQQSPAPFAAYLDAGRQTLLSSSPELFLRIDGAHIATSPIKGTRPRKADPTDDAHSAYELITSPKEIAELVMITDLERNDLGQICEFGSVRVTELLKLERFAQVFHLISTVTGTLREDVRHTDALRACHPGGSITGAPKKRAREIITELEPTPRGAYTGAIGYFGFNGTGQFNIAIRTVVAERDQMHFHVGAGIVADSIPEREYQETLDKAAGILLAAQGARR